MDINSVGGILNSSDKIHLQSLKVLIVEDLLPQSVLGNLPLQKLESLIVTCCLSDYYQ